MPVLRPARRKKSKPTPVATRVGSITTSGMSSSPLLPQLCYAEGAIVKRYGMAKNPPFRGDFLVLEAGYGGTSTGRNGHRPVFAISDQRGGGSAQRRRTRGHVLRLDP